jgi:hypothetical protein
MAISIHSTQMSKLADGSMARRIIATLRKEYPQEIDAMNRQELEDNVIAQIHLAHDYQFESEYAVATFVASAWHLGMGFDKDIPAVAECLANGEMNEEEKAQWLEEFCVLIFNELENHES